jgi:SAM-dependent methyltransferase
LIVAERGRRLRELLGSVPRSALDLGCGAGGDAPLLSALGATTVVGVDLQLDLVRLRPFSPSLVASAVALPFGAAVFETVLMSTLLSSVLRDDLRGSIAQEVDRVLAPGGRVVVYDLRVPNPSNRNITPIRRRELASRFPGYDQTGQSLTVVPQIARRMPERVARHLYGALAHVPALRTHRLTVLRKPS